MLQIMNKMHTVDNILVKPESTCTIVCSSDKLPNIQAFRNVINTQLVYLILKSIHWPLRFNKVAKFVTFGDNFYQLHLQITLDNTPGYSS